MIWERSAEEVIPLLAQVIQIGILRSVVEIDCSNKTRTKQKNKIVLFVSEL